MNADKLKSIISRGVLNTRLKDFYDIYVLMNTKIDEINPKPSLLLYMKGMI